MNKKRVLISGHSMCIDGSVIAIIELLKSIDMSKYEVTLVLERCNGTLLEMVPKEVKVTEMKPKSKLLYALWTSTIPYNGKMSRLLFRAYRKVIRVFLKNISKEKIHGFLCRHMFSIGEDFDAALAFNEHGHFITAYIARGINSKKKVTWLHSHAMAWRKDFIYCFDYYDKIFCVSNAIKADFGKQFPQYAHKTEVCHNQMDANGIIQKSNSPVMDERFNGNYIIVSIGRLEKVKGYDIAIKAAELLKEKGLDFRWFIIGEGSMYDELQNQIISSGLDDTVVMMGSIDNPLPYLKKADIYVQPSRSEGYSVALVEARVLNKIIITTDIPSMREQVIDGKTGILSKLSAEDFANKIELMMTNCEVGKQLKENLKKETIDFSADLQKIYDFIG